MTHEVSAAASSVQMNLMRASPSVLLLATVMAIISFCQLIKHAEAGGKGKGGRQGHIIIQNEVKSNPVPIYMPIPIPIPMPMGPSQHGGSKQPNFQQHHHHHHSQQQQQQQQQRDDGEGEVRKIYLLQPMPHPKPQPNLKGGGFMGVPVQNNIHFGGGMGHAQLSMSSPGKHRHGGSGGGIVQKAFFDGQDQQQHQLQQPIQQVQQQQEEHRHMKSVASEVKILPIVVIPPIAPMPPIQMPQQQQTASHAPRMTLTPQFNNYVLAASSHGRRRASSASGVGGHGFRHDFGGGGGGSEYGGSLGGSVFRERYAGRSRPMRARSFRSQMIGDASEFKSRDYDYGDYEQHDAGMSMRSLDDAGSQWQRRALRYPAQVMSVRRASGGDNFHNNQRATGSSRAHHEQQQQRVKSIRDIIDQDEEALGSGAGSGSDDYESAVGQQATRQPVRAHSSSSSPMQVNLDELMGAGSVGAEILSARSRAPSMEISLDELSLLKKSVRDSGSGGGGHGDGVGAAASTQHELSSLYYDRGNDSNGSAENYAAASASGGSGRTARTRTSQRNSNNYYRLPRPDERDLFDDDDAATGGGADGEWRFDSIKSVSHAAPPPPPPPPPPAANSTMTSTTTKTTLSAPPNATLSKVDNSETQVRHKNNNNNNNNNNSTMTSEQF